MNGIRVHVHLNKITKLGYDGIADCDLGEQALNQPIPADIGPDNRHYSLAACIPVHIRPAATSNFMTSPFLNGFALHFALNLGCKHHLYLLQSILVVWTFQLTNRNPSRVSLERRRRR